MENLNNSLTTYVEQATTPVQEITFVPMPIHPVWEDNEEILQLADQQILQPAEPRPGEQVFAYIGVHAQTVITGKRDSVGFLLTNFRILTKTDFPGIFFAGELPKSMWFTQRQHADEILPLLWSDFTRKNKLSIPAEQLAAMQKALTDVVKIVLPELQKLGTLPQEIVKANTIKDRIKELGLQTVLKTYEQEEKKLKKFAEKHQIADIQFGAVDKPLFGGVYGFVITKTGIVSRDSMEDSVHSECQEILNNPATVGEKKDNILVAEKTHIVPMHHKEFTSSIALLINEIATGAVLL